MDFKQLIRLPKECKSLLAKEIKKNDLESLKKLFNLVKRGGDLGMRYSMGTVKSFQKSKLPKQVWEDRSGHCYELSLFLLACLKYLEFDAYYCEMPDFNNKDHSCVGVKLNKEFILLDPARSRFNIRYKKYRILNKRKTVGNYYVNCSFMFYPNWTKKKINKKEKIKLSKKSLRYARLGLKYDPKSKRAERMIKLNLKNIC